MENIASTSPLLDPLQILSPTISPTVSTGPTIEPSVLPTAVASPSGTIPLNPCPSGSQFSVLCDIKPNQTGQMISNLVSIIIIIAIILTLFYLLIGGIRWIIAGGEKSKVDAARNGIFAAVVGLCLVFLSYLILTMILSLFGISINQLTLPSLELFEK